jgi:hypothetical protein
MRRSIMKNLNFPGSDNLVRILQQTKSTSESHYVYIFDTLINLLEMSLLLFIATSYRCYEDVILLDHTEYQKKTKGIKKIINERFKSPSIGTLLELARNLFHLVNNNDGKAPQKLLSMKECLSKSGPLDSIAHLLNDLDQIIEINYGKQTQSKKVKTILSEKNQQTLLTGIIPKIVEYRNVLKHTRELTSIIEKHKKVLNIDIDNWGKALSHFIILISPILSNTYLYKSIGQPDKQINGNIEDGKETFRFNVDIKRFKEQDIQDYNELISLDDLSEFIDYQPFNISQVELPFNGKDKLIDLFPFLIINEGELFFYKRTKFSGYEYYSVTGDRYYDIPTKRKFSHHVFKKGAKGDIQAFFWTEVLPSINSLNGIKANIPTESPLGFYGRKSLLKEIREDIIEIVNRDGILYGPGGVGKTALIEQLARQLYEEINQENIRYKNIIFISAKKDYYNPFLNLIEPKPKRFASLDHILSAILQFFDMENVEEYDFADKKDLVLELLSENKILLLLDNFETILKSEVNNIIKFFQSDVKKYLKNKPEIFKLIITSRELLPTGLWQIKVDGLDTTGAKQLIKKMFERYKSSNEELSDEQISEIRRVTNGVPIVIIHFIAQIYEYNKSISEVVRNLSNPTSELIQFSFSEIFNLIKNNDVQLKIVILLEIVNYPLMIRQIADILEINEFTISENLPSLLNFQILSRSFKGIEEKYFINDTVDLFTKSLIQEKVELAKEIRSKITSNLTLEKQMDYTLEEQQIIGIFSGFIEKNQYIEAEQFLKRKLDENPKSILLKYHYAKYLKDYKSNNEGAISILLDINTVVHNHPTIIRLIISCYMTIDPPKYEEAYPFICEIQHKTIMDDEIKMEISEFYIGWASFLNEHKKQSDSVYKIITKTEYIEKAKIGITLLNEINREKWTHKHYYIASLGYFDLWRPNDALHMINKAIAIIGNDPIYFQIYIERKKKITDAINYNLRYRH